MIHQRKFQKYHELVFNFIKENIRLPKSPIACVSDGEMGIINAMICVPTLVDVRCWNHVLNDTQRWLIDHGFSVLLNVDGIKLNKTMPIFGNLKIVANSGSFDPFRRKRRSIWYL